jgi:hypothetical protein
MGVDTKAIIRKGTTLEQIEQALKLKYTEIEILASKSIGDYFRILFTEDLNSNNKRMLVCGYNDTKPDYKIDGVYLSLGMWGDSVGILKYLCETFGGYLDENDCDDEGFYPININLFEQGKDFNERDIFVNKVISKLGYGNLKVALELFDEYASEIAKEKVACKHKNTSTAFMGGSEYQVRCDDCKKIISEEHYEKKRKNKRTNLS